MISSGIHLLLIRNNHWTQIYCLAGICDLTTKCTTSRIVSIRNYDSDHLVRVYCNTLHEAHSKIMQLSPLVHKPKCIFCPITGLNFSTYNRRQDHDDVRNQETLNETVVKLNSEIVNFNIMHRNYTPWTNRTVHRRHRNSLTNNYDKLASNGCHLSPSIRQHWAHWAVLKNSY